MGVGVLRPRCIQVISLVKRRNTLLLFQEAGEVFPVFFFPLNSYCHSILRFLYNGIQIQALTGIQMHCVPSYM